jgi:hypothetical protein
MHIWTFSLGGRPKNMSGSVLKGAAFQKRPQAAGIWRKLAVHRERVARVAVICLALTLEI